MDMIKSVSHIVSKSRLEFHRLLVNRLEDLQQDGNNILDIKYQVKEKSYSTNYSALIIYEYDLDNTD